MELYLDDAGLTIYKALASETRLDILNRLASAPATSSELAHALGLSKAILSRHIKILEEAKLIHKSLTFESPDNRKKVYTLKVDRIQINFPQKIYLPFKKKTSEIRLGFFSDFSVTPTCGIASTQSIIGDVDDPRSFVLNDRIEAALLWFSDGYIEYKIPNLLDENEKPELMELSLERFDKPISKFKFSRNSWKYVESMRCWPTMTWTWKLLPNPTATKVHLLYQHMTGPPHKCCIYAGGLLYKAPQPSPHIQTNF